MHRLVTLIVLVTILWSVPALAIAQDDTPKAPMSGREWVNSVLGPLPTVNDIQRFPLFNECAPMRLVVEDLPGGAADIDLTEERVQTLAKNRLRAARLYNEAAHLYLYVRVGVLVSENLHAGAYSVRVSFNKYLNDGALDLNGFAETWNSGSYGTHVGDAGYILQSLSEHLDKFILEYLRVNEDAC